MGLGYYETPTFHPRFDSENWSRQILDIIKKYSDKTSSSDHFPPIFIVEDLPRPPLLGFEVRGDVIFSQSELHCPVISCPVKPERYCKPKILMKFRLQMKFWNQQYF